MSAALNQLIAQLQQYGDTPTLGDGYIQLRQAIIDATAGALKPGLDQLGNNHTYWLARALQVSIAPCNSCAQLNLLVSQLNQYGDTPFLGDGYATLRSAIVCATGGAVAPSLDQLGNNHTYWLALALQYALAHPCSSPVVTPATPTGLDISPSTTLGHNILTWNVQSPTPTSFEIWRSINGAASSLLATVSGSTTTYTDSSSVGSGAIWEYKIRAVTSGSASGFSTPAEILRNVTHASDGTASLSRPNLVFVLGDYSAANCPVATFNVPRLHDCTGSLRLTGNTVAVAMDFTALARVGGSISLLRTPAIITFPALVSVTGIFEIHNNATVTTISCPVLTTVGSSFLFYSNSHLSSVSFPALASVCDDVASGLDFDFSNCPLLTTLSFPSLTNYCRTNGGTGGVFTAGNFASFGGTPSPLVSLSIPALLFGDGNDIDFQGCSLNAVSINQILARCVASGLTSASITIAQGFNAAPTGQGATDKTTLINNGNFVDTN